MSRTLGMTAQVKFGAFGARAIEGKVDTGATVSSLHAENISINKAQNTVSFVCPQLSSNRITLQLEGAQEVHSADAGGVTRPVVTLDVEIDGVAIENASFNLNDRSGMDSPVLIGQNILKAGDFQIDPNQGEEEPKLEWVAEQDVIERREAVIREAIAVMARENVTFAEMATLYTQYKNKE